jgi:uncharacterized protein
MSRLVAAIASAARSRSAAAYVAPMALFLVLTTVESMLPHAWYPQAYCFKILAVTCCLAVFRSTFTDIRPSWDVVVPSMLTGLVVCMVWVGTDSVLPYPRLGGRVGFNPFEAVSDDTTRAVFLTVRMYGLALVVPVMEELSWRSFLLRYLTDNDFKRVPLEAFSWSAFWTVAVLFSAAHPEWLPAVITAATYGLLLRTTRSLFAAVVAHASTNLALGVYILVAGAWQYW